jgi:hypothetical protein
MTLDGLLVECGQQWNCITEGTNDSAFNNILPDDGVFDIQLNFYDPSGGAQTPSVAWGNWLEGILIDQDGTETDLMTYASEYVNGWSGDFYYQTIRIDVSLIPVQVTCFSLRFETTDAQDDVCTQAYEIDRGGCKKWVKIGSDHSNYDCWSNYYGTSKTDFEGTSDFEYDNAIYLPATAKWSGAEISADLKQTELYGVAEVEYLRLIPEEKYPEYLVKYLFKKVLTGNIFNVTSSDDKYVLSEWHNRGTGRINPIEGSNMFIAPIELSRQVCDSSTLDGNCA